MNEEIEYAEMLEIPVSTVNVVHKKSTKKRKTQDETTSQPDQALKETVIAQVNDTLAPDKQALQEVQSTPSEQINESEVIDETLLSESENSGGELDFGDIPERIDTVRLYSEQDRENIRETQLYSDVYPTMDDALSYAENKKEKRVRLVLGVQFAAACALCGAIFLTNVFMPNSAINTFFRALDGAATQQSDARTYTDFTLSGIVNDFSEVEISVSPTGIITFTDACCVYPMADGTVASVAQAEDGTYTLKIAYTDAFTGVFGGLDQVYYQAGDVVKSNVPVAYSGGETEVQMTLYNAGTLLNCFELTEENCLAWVSQE